MKELIERIYNYCIGKPLQALREFPQLQQDYRKLETKFTSTTEKLSERTLKAMSLESHLESVERQRQKDQEHFKLIKETYQKEAKGFLTFFISLRSSCRLPLISREIPTP